MFKKLLKGLTGKLGGNSDEISFTMTIKRKYLVEALNKQQLEEGSESSEEVKESLKETLNTFKTKLQSIKKVEEKEAS